MFSTSDRERFVAQLFTTPILKADAVVVLCGEDALSRLTTGVELVNARCAPTMVLSGGLDMPPRVLSAASLAADALGKGVAPEAIIIEDGSENTRDQAVNVIAIAKANQWRRLLLVASAYHAPRVLLTFIQAATRAGIADQIHLVMVPSSAHWHEAPPGVRGTRLDLYDREMKKIAQFQRAGDCASFAVGLTYLALVEGK